MKVQLNFSSPLLIGGKKHSANFIECDDVIKGSVVRAAFAKVILRNCPSKNDKTFEGKENWVFFRDMPHCKCCKYKTICKNFSDASFSYFYPKDTEIIPLSAKVCKIDNNHGFYDDLTFNDTVCKCGGRLEFTTGLRTKEKVSKPFKVKKTLSMRNAINPYTETSADGMLYSLETIVGTSFNKDINEIVYEGSIHGINEEDLKNFRNLRVGGDTTVGLGKCSIKVVKESKDEHSLLNLQKFSDTYKNRLEKNDSKLDFDKKLNYIAIKFIGDAILNFNFDGTYKTTKELKEIWEKALELDSDIHVDKVYAEMDNYRGYDDSINGSNKREEAISLVKKGTVIVFSSKRELKDLYNVLNNKVNFGNEGINGFGEFKIYLGGIEND